MNCVDFHRQCLAEPYCKDTPFIEHMNGCHGCKEFYSKIRKFELKLDQAINVMPPESLHSSILLRQSLQKEDRFPKVITFIALAATVVFALVINLVSWENLDNSLGNELINYVAENQPTDKNFVYIDEDSIANVLNPLGVSLTESLGPLVAVRPCVIRGKDAAHLIIGGKEGQINILYLPGENIKKRITASYGNNELVIFPCPKGSFAIIGSKSEQLANVEQKLKTASAWL